MKLTIRNIEYQGKLLSRSLRINRQLADMTASFSLLLEPEEIKDIDVTNEVKIDDIVTNTDSGFNITFNLFGGVISEINYENYRDAIRVNINCTSYNIYANRFYVDETVPIEPKIDANGVDRNYAGVYIRELVTKYLSAEGITAGDIQDGAVLTENTLDNYYQTPLSEILDNLADMSAYKWFIDGNKQLNFAEILKTVDKFSEPITAQNPLYRDIVYRKELTDYRNSQIVIGDLPVEDIPDSNYDEATGRLLVDYKKEDEINRLIAMNGGTGIWTNKLEDSKIVTLSDASKVTDKQLNDYGLPPTYFEFSTDISKIRVEPGDSFVVDLPFYGIEKENFIAETVEISDWAKSELKAVVRGNLRDTTTPRGNLFDWLKDIKREVTNVPKLIDDKLGTKDPGDGINRNGLISWIDTSDSATILKDSSNRVLKISDKQVDGFYVAQPLPDYQPYLKTTMGKSYLEFDGTQWMSFESQITTARTVFMVYQDMTIGDTADVSTTFMDGRVGGFNLQGDLEFVFNATSTNQIVQESWLNAIKVSKTSITRYKTDFVILAFTTVGEMSIGKIFDSYYGDKSMTGRLGELLVYNRVLSDSEIDQINISLFTKWF